MPGLMWDAGHREPGERGAEAKLQRTPTDTSETSTHKKGKFENHTAQQKIKLAFHAEWFIFTSTYCSFSAY